MALQNDSDLAFLDVLLVNAEKYNQVFIQKTKPSWINHILSRLVRSPVHFNKMFEILIDMVVSERHPDWAKRALQWLTKIFDNSETAEMAKQCTSSMHRFVSYCSEMNGIERLVNSTLKYINYERNDKIRRRGRGRIIVVDTKYLFIDDPQLNFGAFKKRSKMEEKSGIEGSVDDINNEDASDDVMSDLSGEDDGGASVSEDENASEISEDDGVFDVDRNSLSSFTESQNSTSFPQPRTARVKQVDFEHGSSSDTQIGTDENVSENEESEEEVEGDDLLNTDQPLPSSSEYESEEDQEEERESSDEDDDDSGDSDSEVASTGQEMVDEEEQQQQQQNSTSAEEKSKVILRRSARIMKLH